MTIGKGPNDETCDILVTNELKNAAHLGLAVRLARPTMKSNYRLFGTYRSYYVQFQHFERLLLFIAQTM